MELLAEGNEKMYANEKERHLYGSKSALTLVISLFEIKSVKGRLCKYDHFNQNNSCKIGGGGGVRNKDYV